jgi:hypothetical protein
LLPTCCGYQLGARLNVTHENNQDASIVHDVHHSRLGVSPYGEDGSRFQLNELGRAVAPTMNTDERSCDAILHGLNSGRRKSSIPFAQTKPKACADAQESANALLKWI